MRHQGGDRDVDEGYSAPEQPQKKRGPQDSGDTGPDRAQPELTEQNLLIQERAEADDPERTRALEGDLEEMAEDIKDANNK